jgi:TolB-like protein/tetratricopeptide (TPR) repeat protein
MSGTAPHGDLPTDAREKLKELYLQAMDMDSTARELFLDRAETDTATREEILRLLRYSGQAAQYFSRLSDEIESLVRIEPLLECGEKLDDRFAIVRFLARGGMGEVYEAEDLELGGRLALKVMRPGIVEHAGGLQRFRDEIRLAREVNSPHVCRVYDVARHSGSGRDLVFFTMELLAGETLSDRLSREGPFSLAAARGVIRQMADGLDAAHRAGVLHRDFKSGNVMLCGSGAETRVAITDFGLSRQMGAAEGPGNPLDGATPAYTAPEQLERQEETERTDLYSFGVVLYEMMTGQVPFRGESPSDTARKRLTEAPLPLRQLRPDLPRSWETTVLRCLERDPSRRFPRVMDAARSLGVLEQRPAPSRRSVLWLGAAGAALPAAWVWRRYVKPTAASVGPALAVLSFESPDDLKFLADGVADRISDELTDVPGLRVLARATTQRLPDKGRNVDALAPNVRPTHVLSGRLAKNGENYRITLQLAAVGSGAQTWGRTRDVTKGELEGSSRTFVREIIHAMGIALLPAQISRMDKALTSDAVAYENYLLGRYWVARRDPASLDESVTYLRMAVARDPGFAAAHAALGTSLAHQASVNGIYRPNLVQESNLEAMRALDLDSTLAEAHLVLARNSSDWEWDWQGAEAHFRRALELRPLLATAHHFYAEMLMVEGRLQESLAQIDTAYRLDPLDPSIPVTRGVILLCMGRTDEAIDQQRRVLSADTAHVNGFVQIACSYEEKKLWPQAIEAAQRAVELTQGESFTVAQLGHEFALAGRNAEARKILEELERRYRNGQAPPSYVAAIYTGWHDVDKTFEWLARGVPVRDFQLMLLKVDPQYSFLRGDPRYRSLLAQVHLE